MRLRCGEKRDLKYSEYCDCTEAYIEISTLTWKCIHVIFLGM